jgi:hypothetical protein
MGSDAPPAADPTAPYDIGDRHAVWQTEVNAWPWTGSKEQGWRKSGPCPRCGHTLVVTATGGTLARALTRKATARCSCSGEHANHPDRANRDWGCGFGCIIDPPPAT